HVAYFGQMREHAFQRKQFQPSAGNTIPIPLLPSYSNEGEMLIGINNLTAGDSVSVLFQVAEGSADPELTPSKIVWSVLGDNYWQALGPEGTPLDTTNGLLTSGLI